MSAKSFTTTWKLNDTPIVRPDFQAYPQLRGVVNYVWCPIGVAASEIRLLMLRSEVDKLVAFDKRRTKHTLKIESQGTAAGVGEVSMPGLVFLRAQPVVDKGNPLHDSHLCVAYFTDSRWLASRYSFAIGKQYNVQRPSWNAEVYSETQANPDYSNPRRFLSATLKNAETTWTAQEVLTDLWTRSAPSWEPYMDADDPMPVCLENILGPCPQMAHDSDETVGTAGAPWTIHPTCPVNVIAEGVQLWKFVNHFLLEWGQVLVYDHKNDTFTIKSLLQDLDGTWVVNVASTSEYQEFTGLEELEEKYGPAEDRSPIVNPSVMGAAIQWQLSAGLPERGRFSDCYETPKWQSWRCPSTAAAAGAGIGTNIGWPGTAAALWGTAPAQMLYKDGRANIYPQGYGASMRGRVQGYGIARLNCAFGDVSGTKPASRPFEMHKIFIGLAADFELSTMAREIVYRDDGEGTKTEVLRRPGMPTIAPVVGADTMRDSLVMAERFDSMKSLDLIAPNALPEVMQRVVFWGETADAGKPVEVEGSSYGMQMYDGKAVGALEDSPASANPNLAWEPCWIGVAPLIDGVLSYSPQPLFARKRYTEMIGRAAGTWSPAGDNDQEQRRPLYIVHMQQPITLGSDGTLSVSQNTPNGGYFGFSTSQEIGVGVITAGVWMCGMTIEYTGGLPLDYVTPFDPGAAATPRLYELFLVLTNGGSTIKKWIASKVVAINEQASRRVDLIGVVNVEDKSNNYLSAYWTGPSSVDISWRAGYSYGASGMAAWAVRMTG